MKKFNYNPLLFLVIIFIIQSCATKPPESPDNICLIFKEKKSWYKAVIRSEKRTTVVKLALTLSRYLLGLTELNNTQLDKLKKDIRIIVRGELNTTDLFNDYWDSCLEEKIS